MPFGRRALVAAAALAVSLAMFELPSQEASGSSGAPVAVPSSFSFSGAGFGHGVGMSQYGARGMALDGYTAAKIVTHYYTGTTVAPVPDTMDIRVNLLHHRTTAAFRTEALGPGGGGIEVTVAGFLPVLGTPADTWTLTAIGGGRLTVRRTRAGVTTVVATGPAVTVRWAGTRVPGGAGAAPTLLDLTSSVAGLSSPGHRYRYGWVDVASAVDSPATVEVVNSVRIHDEYLLGIGEVSSSWPMAALEAQVLAARSYALSKYGTGRYRAACRCHVDNGHGPYIDQTFLAWTKESTAGGDRWRAAVLATDASATTGQAILSSGVPITAFYFASSGGATQSSKDVWGGALAFAQSVDDHWSLDPSDPWSSWTPRVRTQAQVAGAFGLPNVVRLDLSSRLVSGAVKVATAYSSTGAAKSISGAALASRLSLPSTWVWRAVVPTASSAINAALATARSATSRTVVVAPASSPAMIALASTLSVRKGWPLLLVTATRIPAGTRLDLVRRKASQVYVVGTPGELPDAILSDLAHVAQSVTRYAGATDSAVSITIAKGLRTAHGASVVVASSADPTSASVGAAAAARGGRALLLLPPGAGSDSGVASYLAALAPSRTTVVGGLSTVSDAALAGLPHAIRLAGADSAATSALVLASLGQAVAPRVALATPGTVSVALLSAPGSPLVVATRALAPGAASYLQRGVASLSVAPGVAPSVVATARRA